MCCVQAHQTISESLFSTNSSPSSTPSPLHALQRHCLGRQLAVWPSSARLFIRLLPIPTRPSMCLEWLPRTTMEFIRWRVLLVHVLSGTSRIFSCRWWCYCEIWEKYLVSYWLAHEVVWLGCPSSALGYALIKKTRGSSHTVGLIFFWEMANWAMFGAIWGDF
jgi:hypothetical protein